MLSFTQNVKLPTKTLKKVIKFVTYVSKAAWINAVITVQTPRVNVLTVKALETELITRPCNIAPCSYRLSQDCRLLPTGQSQAGGAPNFSTPDSF